MRALRSLLSDITAEPAVLWGTGIVGFGTYHYRYESGHEGDAPLVGFAPRAANVVVYLAGGYADTHAELLERLGPHKTGRSCLYLKRLSDIDLDVLRELVDRTVEVHRRADRRSGG